MRREKGISKLILFSLILLLIPPQIPAQDALTPFLLPRIIYVGDPGRLVVPLDDSFAELAPFVLEDPVNLPSTPELLIQRVELDRRGGLSRLFIDFIPFAVGTLSFPALEFVLAGEDPREYSLTLSGLHVEIASILNPAWMALSEPAPPLAVPGTGLLIYGSLASILLVLFLAVAGSIWGKRYFRGFSLRLHRKSLLRGMLKYLRRLERESKPGKTGSPEYHLSRLAVRFREFLSVFTGINCRSLTPAEFIELPITRGSPVSGEQPPEPPLTPVFLRDLFQGWDTLRFSGQDVTTPDLFNALKATERFVLALNRVEREKNKAKPAPRFAEEGIGREGL